MHALRTRAFGGPPSSGITRCDLAGFQQSGMLPQTDEVNRDVSPSLKCDSDGCFADTTVTRRFRHTPRDFSSLFASEAHDLTQDKCLSAVSAQNTQESNETLSRVNETQ